MDYSECISAIALAIAVATFAVNYWWSRKQYQFSTFLTLTSKEADFASAYFQSKHSNDQDHQDKLEQYLNLLEALILAYENSAVNKKIFQKNSFGIK